MADYELLLTDDRIVAMDEKRTPICGAYLKDGYWILYETMLVSVLLNMPIPPHSEHFWRGAAGYNVAKSHVQMIAGLYMLAVKAT